MIVALLLTLAQAESPGEPPPADIVVTASRGKCRMAYAEREMSDRELAKRASEWARGVPVRLIAPTSWDYKCLAKIAFKLNDKGVRLIEFVDPKQH